MTRAGGACGVAGALAGEEITGMDAREKSVAGMRRRARRQSGNTIIEMAFTLVPTFALIFGFADFGIVLWRWTTLQNAVREGCRYAVTFRTNGTEGQDSSIEDVVTTYAMGLVTKNDTPQHIYVKYYAPGALTTPINSGGNVPNNIVEVSVQNYAISWITPLSGNLSSPTRNTSAWSLNIYSSDLLGGYPAGVTSVTE